MLLLLQKTLLALAAVVAIVAIVKIVRGLWEDFKREGFF